MHLFDCVYLGAESGGPEEGRLIELRGADLDWDKPIAVDIWDTEAESGAALPFDR